MNSTKNNKPVLLFFVFFNLQAGAFEGPLFSFLMGENNGARLGMLEEAGGWWVY